MADPFYLKVMGTPELLDPFGRRIKFRVRKHLALLIYLVLDGRGSYRREHLAELLWPLSREKGGQSLSMACSVLRSVLGPDCMRGLKSIAQFALPRIVTDLQRLERRELFGSELDPPLEVDGLLRDFDLDDAPEFQHWVDRKRAEFLPSLKAGLAAFIDQARRTGDTRAMQGFADRLIELDSLSETATAARMEAFAMQGDRLGALRLYESWKRVLMEQLGAAPSRELETLAGRLRRRTVALAASPAAAIADQQAVRPFIGRTAEYRVLFEAWEATNSSQTTHVQLIGESGVGKSTLALRFGSAASLAGGAVARVQCFELEQRIAFGTMGALITQLLDRPGVAGTPPAALAEVARIVPKVRERFPNLPAPLNTEGEAARLHFAEGAFAMFDAIMEDQPLVLVVDDYPRSDEASLSVLHLLLRRGEHHRLMLILTARPPEPGEPRQAGLIRQSMSYLPVRRIEMSGLSEGESEALLHGILEGTGKQPAAPERRAILRTASGNPMALELLVRDWAAHPDAPLALLLTAMRSDVAGAALGAEDYDQFIERMLPALSARHRVALFLAVILGPRLNDFRYFGVLELTTPQIMAAVSELVEFRIIRSTERGLEFVNEVMRARLYLKIPAATRVRLHDGVATLLLEAMGRGDSISRLEVAWHLIRAKRRDEAAPHLITGARQSLAKGAPDEAARALGSALRELKGQVWQEASLLLAEAYDEMGDSKAILETIAELKATGPTDPSVHELCEELEIDARSKLGLLAPREAAELVKQFIICFRNRSTHEGKARAALASVRMARELSDPGLFEQLQEALERLPIDLFETKEKITALIARAMIAFHRRDTVASASAAQKAKDLLASSGRQDTTLVSVTMGLGVLATASGEYLESIEPFEAAVELAKKIGNEGMACTAAGNLAMSHYRLGNYPEQYRWGMEAHRLRGRALTFDRVRSEGLLALAEVCLNKSEDVERRLALLHVEASTCEAAYVRQWGMYFAADINWLLGRKQLALEAAAAAGAGSSGPLIPALTGVYSRWSCLYSLHAGSEKEQLERLRKLRQQKGMLDALDRAELDCALLHLCNAMGLDGGSYERGFREAIAVLPTACKHHLELLGLLASHS